MAAAIADDLRRDQTLGVLVSLRDIVYEQLEAAQACRLPAPPSDQLVFNWEREEAARRHRRQSPRDPAI